MTDKEQLGPRVTPELAESYKWLVRKENGGVYRGRLGQEMEKAMRAHMGWFATLNPEVIDELADEDPDLANEFAKSLDVYEDMMSRVRSPGDQPSAEDVDRLEEEVRRLGDITYSVARDMQDLRRALIDDGDERSNGGEIASLSN